MLELVSGTASLVRAVQHRARQIQNAMGEQLTVGLGSDSCRKLGYIRLVASH